MSFSSLTLVRQSVRHYRALGIAVVLGVAAATAVVCGALLVGDSMRGSLRALTLERLGTIDGAVIPGGFFDHQRVTQSVSQDYRVAPVILFSRGVVEVGSSRDDSLRRAGDVQIVACNPLFWDFDVTGIRPKETLEGESVVLNQAAADELQVSVGDKLTVRLPQEQAVPADSPLGRRDVQSEGLPNLTVVDILPNKGIARFGLQPSQANPLCAFLPLEIVQEVLDRPGQANTLLVGSKTPMDAVASENALRELETSLSPSLQDFGLALSRVTQSFPSNAPQPVFDYYQVTSDRMLLSDATAQRIHDAIGTSDVMPILTYLANAIEKDSGTISVPYSTITAIEPSSILPMSFAIPNSGTDNPTNASADSLVPLVLNSWAATRLQASIGDRLTVYYYEPETSSGREIEKSFAAVLTDIVPVTIPSQPYRRRRPAEFSSAPTVFNDPDLTPTVPGVTDQDSINDWDLPFELDRKISKEDDDYWAYYRLTPKAFIPLEAGQRLFASRFGQTTSLRVEAATAASVAELESRILQGLRPFQAELGYQVLPIKAQQLAASRGTTPFDGLFLALSFFVIFAALLLVALLFRLGMEQRAKEYGTLFALGLPGKRVSRMALVEGICLAIPGAVLGTVLGIAYAWMVLWGLRNWWVGAVTVPFLEFHWTTTSLIVGLLAGLLMATGTIALTARKLRRVEISPLLAGIIPEKRQATGPRISPRWSSWVAPLCLFAAMALGVLAFLLHGPAQAGAFVGGGMFLLIAMIMFILDRFTTPTRMKSRRSVGASYSLWTLAIRGVARNPLRSTLSIGLMAIACFLIISMSAFQMRPTDSGVGGFELLGRSATPIYKDLRDSAILRDYLGRDEDLATQMRISSVRFRPGQDASCNNLYQATQPQVLGVPSDFLPPTPFDWASIADQEPTSSTAEKGDDALAREARHWQLLQRPALGTADDPVPVILDQNTAMWSLQMLGGIGEVRAFKFDDGQTRHFKVVGLLANSVLQGSLIVGEANFQRLFPSISGYSFFLVQTLENTSATQVSQVLENRFGDAGLDLTPSRTILENMMAVQNTYLRTFQSLGALGLLLGTFGLAIVQLRNVLERRGELSLLRAIGFSRSRLAGAVMLENVTLLLSGIGCGVGSALAAVIPYFVASRSLPAIQEPLLFLAVVLFVGLCASFISVQRVLRMSLKESL